MSQNTSKKAAENIVNQNIETDICNPLFEDTIFHIFGINGLDVKQLWELAPRYCSCKGSMSGIDVADTGENDDVRQQYICVSQGHSTQGVIVTCFPNDNAHLHIELPWHGSFGDVELAFAFLKAIRNIFPECEIYYNDTYDSGQFAIEQENIDVIDAKQVRNMMELVQMPKKEHIVEIEGVNHHYCIPSQEDYPDMTLEELTEMALADFIRLQWAYTGYENAGNATVTNPDGEEYAMCLLTNTNNTFVPVCLHIGISNKEGKVKDVPTADFIRVAQNNPHFNMVDKSQFILDKMSDEEWENLYDSINGFEIDNEKPACDGYIRMEVSLEVFNEYLSGKNNHIDIPIQQHNYLNILENIDGNLILDCDDMPEMFYGCHFWNKGKFPYKISENLKYITLLNQGRELNLGITGHRESVRERCDFLSDNTVKPNSNGDACLWNVRFHVEVSSYGGVSADEETGDERERNFFLLRWNPAISMTLDGYSKCFENDWQNRVFDWSIYEWQAAHKGDVFFMIREGQDESAGIVFRGVFESEPYVDEDWRGTANQRHYCLFVISDQPSPVVGKPHINMEQLEISLPEINWRKGHSGEKITKEQAGVLWQLWDGNGSDASEHSEKTIGNDDNEFDAEQGHGSHLQCIDDDVDYVIGSFMNIIGHSKNLLGAPEVTLKNEGVEYDSQLILLSSDENQDITLRSILEARSDGNELISIFPYVVNNERTPMTLKKIDEFSNGIEAVLTCEYDGSEFRFFDVDYPLHKKEYILDRTYLFALSALAYDVEKVPDNEMFFNIEPEIVEKMHEYDPSVVKRDEKGNALPMKMSMDVFVACLQHDGKHPDDAEFWSQVQSKVRKTFIINREFYRMVVKIYHDEDEKNVINIPLVAKTSFFENKPNKSTSLRGYLWLQGRMMEG